MQFRKCRKCAEKIPADATMCRFCGAEQSTSSRLGGLLKWLAAAIVVGICLVFIVRFVGTQTGGQGDLSSNGVSAQSNSSTTLRPIPRSETGEAGGFLSKIFGHTGSDGVSRTDLKAGDLVLEIQSNPEATLSRYKDEPLRITGTIMSLETDDRGVGQVNLGSDNSIVGASAALPPEDTEYLRTKPRDQPVSLLCSGVGVTLGIAQLTNCIVER